MGNELKVFNANTQENEQATITEGKDKELVVSFADGSFFKLPAGLTDKEVKKLLELHEEHNRIVK